MVMHGNDVGEVEVAYDTIPKSRGVPSRMGSKIGGTAQDCTFPGGLSSFFGQGIIPIASGM